MENATYQEGCPPASPAFGMPMPEGPAAGYAPGAEHGGGQAAGYGGYADSGAPVGPLGAPMEGQAMTAAAAEPCAEPSVETEEGNNKYQYQGRKPAQEAATAPPVPPAPGAPQGYAAQGPSGYAKGYFQPAPGQAEAPKPQPAPGASVEHVCSCGGHEAQDAPEPIPGAQYAAPQGPQYAAPQGPQYAAPQGPQYAAPQGPQYAPQQGAPYAAPHEHEEGEGKKGHCHGHGGHAQQAQEPQAGFFGFPGFGSLGGFAGAGGSPSEDPKHMEYRYGQMIELCNDLMQGKADPGKIAAFLTSTGAHFWKGAVVGAAVTFLLTNDAVKSALGDTFSAVFGAAKGGE